MDVADVGPSAPARPTTTTRWRCRQCGNLTRFDVVRRARVQEFVHQSLSGEAAVEETTLLDEVLEEVRCRWCGGTGTVELVERPDAVSRAAPAEVALGDVQVADVHVEVVNVEDVKAGDVNAGDVAAAGDAAPGGRARTLGAPGPG